MGAKAFNGCQCLFLRRKEYRTRQGDWASPQSHPTLQLCPDWFDHLVMKVTWLPKCSLHPQGLAVFLSGSAMSLRVLWGEKNKKDFQDQKRRGDPVWRVIGCLSKSKETDPIFLPNEDLRELETRKRIQFLGFIQLEFPGTPRKGYKATVIYSQKERGKTATTQAEKNQAPLPAAPPPAVGNPSSYLG